MLIDLTGDIFKSEFRSLWLNRRSLCDRRCINIQRVLIRGCGVRLRRIRSRGLADRSRFLRSGIRGLRRDTACRLCRSLNLFLKLLGSLFLIHLFIQLKLQTDRYMLRYRIVCLRRDFRCDRGLNFRFDRGSDLSFRLIRGGCLSFRLTC